jgi:peptidoglycan-associated lipoprotein
MGALFAAVLALGVGLTGCQTTKKSGADAGGTQGGFNEGTVPSGSGAAGSSILQKVYFDFDSSEIRADGRTTLKQDAGSIQSNPGWGTITVEGHCDERGSEEYNLALGERRASAVKQYLVDLGVPSSRLRTVSFGEAKPAVVGHDESAWRYNRRVEFKAGS